LAFQAEVTEVEGVDPLDEFVEVLFFISEEAGFEITAQGRLCAEASSGEVCGADEGLLAVDNDGLGVNTRAEDALEEIGLDECWIAIEVFAESGAWLFGVEEADGNALLNEVGEDFEKGDETSSFFHVEVFDVRRDNPEESLSLWDEIHEDTLVDILVKDQVGHAVSRST